VKLVVEVGAGYNVGLAEFAVIPERNTTTYTYDVLNNLKTVTDAAILLLFKNHIYREDYAATV
jgi:hypothetical protein